MLLRVYEPRCLIWVEPKPKYGSFGWQPCRPAALNLPEPLPHLFVLAHVVHALLSIHPTAGVVADLEGRDMALGVLQVFPDHLPNDPHVEPPIELDGMLVGDGQDDDPLLLDIELAIEFPKVLRTGALVRRPKEERAVTSAWTYVPACRRRNVNIYSGGDKARVP